MVIKLYLKCVEKQCYDNKDAIYYVVFQTLRLVLREVTKSVMF